MLLNTHESFSDENIFLEEGLYAYKCVYRIRRDR